MISKSKNKKKKRIIKHPDTVIGWKEWISLPELGIPAVKAKIDIGARTSALHTFDLEEFESNGMRMVRFGIHPLQKRKDVILFCECPVLERRRVKNTGGQYEKRYVIQTDVVLGGERWPIEVSLADRDTMLFRMLLGRIAVAKKFLVNPGQAYLTGRSLAKTYLPDTLKKGKQ